MKNFKRALAKYADAKAAMVNAAINDFPVGVEVFYDYGTHERRGIVNLNSNNNARVRILTPNEKEVWIDCEQITRVMAQESGAKEPK